MMFTLRSFCWITLVFGSGLLIFGSPARSQELVDDSLSALHRASLGKLTTPEHQARIATRRGMQQKGYADILFHTLRHDGLWGMIASARSHLQLEYSLPREPLVIYVPIRQPEQRGPRLPGFTGAPSPPMAIPLYENRAFPEDPWAKR